MYVSLQTADLVYVNSLITITKKGFFVKMNSFCIS